ncbi:hypothetical protein HYH03_010917 [Edaphochlamys debaryana]|uniref:Uncharacterized protein n=1 Tax=Edaphochlamys debaryana TaxID=47281 RepID=A0A836BWA1_9CHLO|nr:hypothetical protein HYH03_010917 [Edaphochlamys debaryana]|eukprot:KAG2490767.1 hypothetical protein HYH03_010917 [Edaphochlamys debaryana]
MVALGEPSLPRGREWRILPLLHEAGVPFGPSSQGIFTRAVARGAPIATLDPIEESKADILACLQSQQQAQEEEEEERAGLQEEEQVA